MPNRQTDNTRLALLEQADEHHEKNLKDLSDALRGLTSESKELRDELAKTREAMIRKFSFMAGVATAFGAIGGLIGAGIGITLDYFVKK